MSQESKKYKGVLAKRIKPRRPMLLAAALRSQDALRSTIAEHDREDREKLIELAAHYNIPVGPNFHYELLLALAREYVPGFQEETATGRKKKWTFEKQFELADDVDALVVAGDVNHGIDWATQQLAKSKKWAAFLSAKDGGTADPAEALRKAYYGAKEQLKILRELMKESEKY
ncbi:hypothetical protein [Ralstonia insidiosa]|uniref:Uncharacterized protein n=1 Tax=Ralstonia insidiosa TaxID=190721 RepID=A0A848P7X4_9RALS|nr:hypothetical protein [Ralstonia insidiosa]NMV41840.1 hypothetical protein [Ralstonia insidiosa]